MLPLGQMQGFSELWGRRGGLIGRNLNVSQKSFYGTAVLPVMPRVLR